MQKQVTVALQTVCDLSMQDYVESEQSVDEQNKIADKIAGECPKVCVNLQTDVR